MASRILRNLWIGDMKSSYDIDFLKSNKITDIVNCTKDIPFYEKLKKENGLIIKHHRVAVEDNLQEEELNNMAEILPIIVQNIGDGIENGKRFLIHCRAGKQRSAIVVFAVMYRFSKIAGDEDKIFKYMRRCRNIVFTPSMNFYISFEIFKKNFASVIEN